MNREQIAYEIAKDQHLLPGETLEDGFRRCANAYATDTDHADRIKSYLDKRWFMAASPVLANAGSTRGLPISCFAAGTLVLTVAGFKPIEKIVEGDFVQTHTGKFQKIVSTRKSKSKDIYNLVVNKRRTPLLVTGNHRLLSNYGWKRVDELNKFDDLLACDYKLDIGEVPHTIKIKNSNTSFTQFKRTQLKPFVKVDSNLAWALGFWFAEGSISHVGTVKVTHGTSEPCQRFVSIMEKSFGLKGKVRKNKTWFDGELNSKTLCEWFDSEFGKGCKTKTLKDWILYLPKKELEEFFNGFYEGDGFKTTHNKAFELANPELVAGFHQILCKLGVKHSLQLKKHMCSTGNFHGIVTIENISERRKNTAKTGVIFNNLQYNQIETLEKLDVELDVYDIQVEEDESFVAAGVVAHNCFLNSVGDSREGILDHYTENGFLSSYGGGIGGDWSNIRSVGQETSNGVTTTGLIPFVKVSDSQTMAFSQGSCYAPETEVLTGRGWVDFSDLQKDDVVATVEEDRSVVFNKPLEIVINYYEGDMYEINSKGFSLNVTANHRMVIERRKQKNNKKYWSGNLEEVPAEEVNYHRDVKHHCSGIFKTNSLDDFHKFLIACQADGSVQYVPINPDLAVTVSFHLAKDRKVKRLKAILDALKWEYKIVLTGDTTFQFSIKVPRKIYEINKNKFKSLSWFSPVVFSAEDFLEEVSHWDSGFRTEHLSSFKYSSVLKENIDVVQAACAVGNKRCSVSVSKNREGNRQDLWSIYVYDYTACSGESVEKRKYYYKGKVYCCVVPNGRLIVRYKNTVSICGNTRRGAYAAYLDVSHPEIEEFIEFRKPTGDPNRRCLNIHHGINISDEFMEAVLSDDFFDLVDPNSKTFVKTVKARELWIKIIELRLETGEPYLHFSDTSNRLMHPDLKKQGLKINGSNLCSEIFLPTSEDRTAVCCLSSINLAKYDEWKDHKHFIGDLVEFLDNVIDVFCEKAPKKQFWRAINSAYRERSIGLGTMGFHTFLQSKMVPFDSVLAKSWNNKIFKQIWEQASEKSENLAKIKGSAPDLETTRRNAHLLAIAPNATSSIVCGGVSPGIEPTSNSYTHKTKTLNFTWRNSILEGYLKNDEKLWREIHNSDGSVQHLNIPESIKEVFKTPFELNQQWLIDLAADRQHYIDQGQSLNLFFTPQDELKYINQIHLNAWKQGLKSLYYVRNKSVRRPENIANTIEREIRADSEDGCLACEG